MLSYLLFVVSLVGNSGFVHNNRIEKDELMGRVVTGETGGLVVTMGPVINLRVADVRVIPANDNSELPAITRKGSLFEGFSKSRLFAVRYGK
jgi:hypothetical protein